MDDAKTVLVVDDEPQLLRLLTRALAKRGLRVLTAADGDEALARFDEDPRAVDAALLDVVLPPAGIDPVLSRILSVRDDVGIVLTSGDELEPSLRERLEQVGGVFLRKPFSPSVAYATLERLMQVIAARAAVAAASED